MKMNNEQYTLLNTVMNTGLERGIENLKNQLVFHCTNVEDIVKHYTDQKIGKDHFLRCLHDLKYLGLHVLKNKNEFNDLFYKGDNKLNDNHILTGMKKWYKENTKILVDN